jgi:hypothetical protein
VTHLNVSLLLNAELRGFSVGRLFTILNGLGLAVEAWIIDRMATKLEVELCGVSWCI